MTTTATERPTDAAPGALSELRCRRRACDALLARVVGAVVVCLDGTKVGPVAGGIVVERRCPRCGTRNLFWL